MSYTITISGQQQAAEGQSPDQGSGDVISKARAFVQSLPGVTAAFIQTEAGMTDLNEQPQAQQQQEPAAPQPGGTSV